MQHDARSGKGSAPVRGNATDLEDARDFERAELAAKKRPRPGRRRALIRRGALPALGATILIVIVVASILGPVLSPFDGYKQNLRARLQPPGWENADSQTHWFGTDQLGRDVLTRALLGGRLSLAIAFVAVTGSAILGIVLGIVAAYRGGLLDDIVMRLVDLQLALPMILLALAVVALLGPSVRNVILVFVITGWPIFARTVRSSTLTLRDQEFVIAARSMGARDTRIVRKHIFPNAARFLIVIASFEVGKVVIYEASLGFLGMGAQPPTPTWGNMMGDGRAYLETAWWLVFFPGLLLVLTAAAGNYIGDGLNEFLDPRSKKR
jgi:peptide/nickel transport system permease protein